MLKNLIFLTKDKSLQKEVADFLSEWESSSSSITVKTSGSTGVPKEMTFLKDHLRISAQKTIDTFCIPKGGSAFLCLSLQTIAGKMMVVRACENEMTLYVGDTRTNALCRTDSDAFDLMAVVPLQLEEGLKCNPSILRNTQTILVGGGSISNELADRLSKHQLTVVHTYGMTETLTHIAYRRVGFQQDDRFKVLPGIALSSEDGCLCIHYPEINVNTLRTTDLVSLYPDGTFTIDGRADFVVNSGGIKFHPEALEKLIENEVNAPFFIGGLHDETLGEKLVLLIEGDSQENTADLLKRIKPLLPKHGCPKEVHYVAQFIRTESLKIKRKETLGLL